METHHLQNQFWTLTKLPHDVFLVVVGYLTSPLNPLPLVSLFEVCQAWRDYLDVQDSHLWQILSIFYSIPLHIPSKHTVSRFSLRSAVNYKRQFFQVFHRERVGYEEKHEAFILQAKLLLENKRDCVGSLKKLILKMFPKKTILFSDSNQSARKKESKKSSSVTKVVASKLTQPAGTSMDNLGVDVSVKNSDTSTTAVRRRGRLKSNDKSVVTQGEIGESSSDFLTMIDPYFNANWKGLTLESNSLLTLSARYCHLKSMRFIVEELGGNIDIADVGGFTALIICAFRGFMPGVQYCVKQGANISLIGRLRSGDKLTAEHWAAVQGQTEIMQYLRAHRMREEKKAISAESSKSLFQHVTTVENRLNMETMEMTSLSTSSSSSSAEVVDQGPDAITPSTNSSSAVSGSFCVCGKGFLGFMVACDHPQCIVEWYHFECVGLLQSPEGEWICPVCRGEAFSQPIKIRLDSSHPKKKRKLNRVCGRKEDLMQPHAAIAMLESSLLDEHVIDYFGETTNDSIVGNSS